MQDKIIIKGAREHNLKNINLELPRNKMVVFTGLSGSGKSSLAFDTIFAEGQRRYIESLSAYARQFLGRLDKPDVDEIEGLSPAISIDQKAHSSNPRSTVATITEIYDYLRVLFARAGVPYCPICGTEIRRMTLEGIVDAIVALAAPEGPPAGEAGKIKKELVILAPTIRGRKGEYYQLLYDFLSAGFREARVDGEFKSLRERMTMARYKQHTIELVVDRMTAGIDLTDKDNRLRLSEAVEAALKHGNDVVTGVSGDQEVSFSAKFSCPRDNFSFPDIEPRLFSFNSPYGACPECHGLGTEDIWSERICKVCLGKRLRPESLSVLMEGKNITEVTSISVEDSYEFFGRLDKKLKDKARDISETPLREIRNRLKFMIDVGLGYLTLDRKAGTLSGGESQRIRLASQIGSRLVGTLYILDEPTIGLHQKDNAKLIKTLHDLRDLGNTIIVVEHDEETIRSADYLVDIGPAAGIHGGKIVAEGPIPEIFKDKKQKSLTLDYLRGDESIKAPAKRRPIKLPGDFIKLRGVSQNNLKNLNLDIPLRHLVAVTGVSGSGKSTLVYDVLYKAVANRFNHANYKEGAYKSILGLEYINRVINVDQGAIGRTPRSNPATYIGAWTHIRDLFASTEDARVRGWKPGRFSFNVRGGRCENCEGHGYLSIEMHFLPTVYVTCDTCHGKRFDRETLEVEYHRKNIYEVLKMTVEEAVGFFKDIPWLHEKLQILEDVGLGYLELGQSATTLSGGEAQRIKLSAELGKRDTRRTLYLLDEPTTGLHFDDVKKLLEVLQKLVDRGNTVVVIEHNLDVIKSADWVFDLGPEGGSKGGEIVAKGTPEDIVRTKGSFTGEYLRKVLK
ncbi:MAG: ABC-ATPase UvrA [Candidatus Colwellbacteria bacterium RIFCSPHIGHO2_12_FULL_43_12]|uniref:UvrABC system protein A n=1 Tax=Candidatus Colwellbacteria bacterium RIFCSPHIGHO2_12_FULL_43_12 TaxID=1797688 RepID=A0A1G1Z3V0_9BACT|nr:MAG: ABC-ATPase UvrA [Candidatus Colwellbacteria bacterium RIFCSPHIGHO2_12_FULL_43_12]